MLNVIKKFMQNFIKVIFTSEDQIPFIHVPIHSLQNTEYLLCSRHGSGCVVGNWGISVYVLTFVTLRMLLLPLGCREYLVVSG